ncbi:MAG: hypothetical protein V2A34_01670 [Lentisphaerota bacterium]
MANTDFFDDDLIKQRDAAKKIKLGQTDEPLAMVNDLSGNDEVPVRPVSDFNLTRMAKHKQEVDDHVATAMQELERLRKRQEDLEREKRELEDLRRKQAEYEGGKREMVERLSQSLVILEKNELQSERLVEMLGATRKRFRNLLADIEGISEDAWPEDQIRDELNKALMVLEDARMEYNKSMAKIDAMDGGGDQGSPDRKPVIFEENRFHAEENRSFAYWLKVGAAMSMPLLVTIVLLVLLFFVLHSMGFL